jgi:hypothetical protein
MALLPTKTQRRLTMLLKILFALLAFTSLCFAQEPRVSWFDDFLGARLHPGYVVSLAGTGTVRIAEGHVGGAVLLAAMGYGDGAARLRFGEEPVSGAYNALNFSARKNFVYQTRLYLNRNTEVAATVGLIGFADPQNVIAALYGEPGWVFEVANEGLRMVLDTGFRHAPGNWVTFKIVTQWGETPKASLYINDRLVAEVEGEYVPSTGICPEYQVWNRSLDDAYSQPTMWIDYLSVSQER